MAMPVRSWAKMAPDRQAALRGRAAELLTMLEAGSLL